jgi:hypothetical protein
LVSKQGRGLIEKRDREYIVEATRVDGEAVNGNRKLSDIQFL